MFGSLGLPELLILLAIVVLIFGVNKLPKLGKGLGEDELRYLYGLIKKKITE